MIMWEVCAQKCFWFFPGPPGSQAGDLSIMHSVYHYIIIYMIFSFSLNILISEKF